jgi:hypothetical protein
VSAFLPLMRGRTTAWLLSLCGCVFVLGCGPKSVRSPDWVLGQPQRYPVSRFITGVGSAPTAGGLPQALKAASASARAEIAQTIEVRIDHVQELLRQNTASSGGRGRRAWALEAERSDLSSFTRTSSEQLVQGIELKEKYHDRKRDAVYVLATLDRSQAAARLEEDAMDLDEHVRLTEGAAAAAEYEGDRLTAVRLYRQALGHRLRADVLRRQLRVIEPRYPMPERVGASAAQLATQLNELLRNFDLYVQVDEAVFVEEAVRAVLADTDFSTRLGSAPADTGLTLWGSLTTKWDTFPALDGGEALQVCRVYLSLKIIDNRTQRIAGQINLMANSNAREQGQARERALRLLSDEVLKELPQRIYDTLSAEVEG